MRFVSDITNCRFSFLCNMKWDELNRIESTPSVRYCQRCETAVHLCRNPADFDRHAEKGHSIAYFPESQHDQQELIGLTRRPAD